MKKQLIFQKITTFAMFLSIVFMLIFTIGIMTSIFETLYVHSNLVKPDRVTVAGANIFYDLQDFNRQLFSVTFFVLLLCLILFFTNSHKRRKYYITNYIATGIVSSVSIGVAVWAIGGLMDSSALYLSSVDFEALWMYHEMAPTFYAYSDSTIWFDICIASCVLVIVCSLTLIGNSIWKFLQLKREDKLLRSCVLTTTKLEENQNDTTTA